MDFNTPYIQMFCLVISSRIPLISVLVKHPQPSNVSGMDNKGIYPFRWKSRYYSPDENGGLSRWADHTPMVTYSLSPRLELSPRHPHVRLSLTLDIHIFILLMILCFLCIGFPISLDSPPSSFSRFPVLHIYQPYRLFSQPQQHMVPEPQQYINVLLYSTPSSIPQRMFPK